MLKSIAKILLLAIVISALALYFLFSPTYATQISYKGSNIIIRRNENSIPNIYAPSRQSYFYAIGWVQAEDRLFQMTFKMLLIHGRLSQFLGEKALAMDQSMRQLDFDGWGRRAAQRIKRQNKTQYDNIQAFVDSINDYAHSLTVLPFDFQLIRYQWEDWTAADVFGLFKLLEWSQSMNLVDEYTRSLLLANHTQEEVGKLLPITKYHWAFNSTVMIQDEIIPSQFKADSKNEFTFQHFSPEILKEYTDLGLFEFFKSAEGSNVFAISGQHTKSGSPILVHDPHLENVMPSQWYQIQAVYHNNGANHSISGVSCSGVPFIIGKTDYMAMGITTIYMDNQDIYRQKIIDNKYFVNGKWIDLQVRQEIIKVKTSNGIKEQPILIRSTHRGPIISYIFSSFGSFKTGGISLRWTGFNDQYSSIVTATLVPEVKDLEYLKHYLLYETEYLFNVNFVFITRDGHIGYQQLGRYPIRRDPASAHFVKDGSTTYHDWLGFVPPHHRLQIIDPPQGYFANGNNKIANHIYYGGLHDYTIYTSRSDRLHELISSQIAEGRKFELQDVKKIVSDTVDTYCRRILPDIKALIPEAEILLGHFDCNFTKDSSSAAVYEVFMYELHKQMTPLRIPGMSTMSFHPAYQQLFNFIKESQENSEKTAKIRFAWLNMKQNLTAFFNSNKTSSWLWGKYHKDAMHHLPFGSSSLKFLYDRVFDGFGNMHTVNVGKMNKVGLGNFETSHRANYRAIYTFKGENLWIIDSGSSEKFFSSHYDDQWKLFQNNQFLTLRPPSFSAQQASEL